MLNHVLGDRSSLSTLIIGGISLLLGITVGLLTINNPIYLGLLFVAISVLIWFFTSVDQAILSLLIVRSSLDLFSAQQVPAALGVGISLLTLLYVVVLLLSRQEVQTDWFWWFFAGWLALQGIWVVLLPLGGLGLGVAALPDAIREWVRFFSWLMVYLLVMQLKGKVPPTRIITALFLSLVAPLAVAFLQTVLPPSVLPSVLVFQVVEKGVEAGSRINGTLGHPNSFATFTLLFFALCLWKQEQSQNRWLWLGLAAVLVFFLVGSKSLTGLVMLLAFAAAFFVPKLNVWSLLAGTMLIGLTLLLLLSTELGRDRLGELSATPLLNPDLDWDRAVALQMTDSAQYGNSFNWRLAQWKYLLQSWQAFPILGYGLATTSEISVFQITAHNDYIRFLVEEGIVGLGCFLAFLGAQAVRLGQILSSPLYPNQHRQLSAVLLAFLLAMLVGMLAGNVMVHTTLFFYWWTLIAVVGWEDDRSPKIDEL